ncbi:MAG TPA: LodA/GoxA family CTQ-dependent oxidase [Longimicrobium sp.]|nr:LodA/GoxA family CTQ-dependent oxidase [Longimicrobium sp.]
MQTPSDSSTSSSAASGGGDAAIVRAAIHPAIGVARMGNSQHDFYVGPEVTEPLPQPPGFMHDASGALKREAARFRVYGYDAAGKVVRELTAGDGVEVRWTVHVANHKAAWYQWRIALDIPEAAGTVLPLRNATVTDRAGLVIDPGPRSISGAWQGGAAYELNGAYQGTPVYLGEIRTDEAGRLLFLGGRGVSASPTGTPIYIDSDPNSFINADGWYDDASDGPVTAEVTVGGRSIPVDPAWVVTAPPNYAPEAIGVRTLYDLLQDLYIQNGWMKAPAPVSFRRDVYPILQRLTNLQWVNAGFASQFGKGGPHPFDAPAYVRTLSWLPKPGGYDVHQETRLQVFHSFRDPNGTDANQLPWPWIYGDAMDVPPAQTPRQNASVSPTQYAVLQAWAAGKFVDDWEQPYDPPRRIEAVPLQEQPAMLDKAAAHFCLADAFHPGCEVTWPVRHITMYSAPFRIIHRPAGQPEPDYGPTLTPEVALSATGPLYAQGPGDLTRWMGLPWQADTGFCRSGYSTKKYSYDPFIPTFWPARVPNQVLTAEAYAVVRDATKSKQERLDAFTKRALWVRFLDAKTTAGQMEQMVNIFGDMGVVELREGVPGDPDFPAVIGVEALGGALAHPQAMPKAAPSGLAAAAAGVMDAVAEVADVVAEAVAPAVEDAAPEEALRPRRPEEAEEAPTPVRHPHKT